MSAKIAESGDGTFLKISIVAEDVETPPPQDIVAVIDISGSMDASCAGVTDGKTQYIDLGFSLLDLVKHATKSIIGTLRN